MLEPSTVTIAPNDWNSPITVTLTTIDDAIADGDDVIEVGMQNITTADTAYATQTALPVAITVVDDDTSDPRPIPLNRTWMLLLVILLLSVSLRTFRSAVQAKQ